MNVRRSARSRRPITVSETTKSSRRTSSALRPRATAWTLFGRSSASHGFDVARRMRMRNRKYEERHAILAPIVVAEGVRPESPIPWDQLSTSAGVTWSGVLSRPRKSGQSIRPYPSTVRREPERFPFSTRKA
jgi:hypothetical protein